MNAVSSGFEANIITQSSGRVLVQGSPGLMLEVNSQCSDESLSVKAYTRRDEAKRFRHAWGKRRRNRGAKVPLGCGVKSRLAGPHRYRISEAKRQYARPWTAYE